MRASSYPAVVEAMTSGLPESEIVHAMAVVESPYGPLECVITGADENEVLAQEGERVFRDEIDEVVFVSTRCVDRRGLVITLSDYETSLWGWSRFEPGVDGQVDELPWPLRD